jgi:hypothetical protein
VLLSVSKSSWRVSILRLRRVARLVERVPIFVALSVLTGLVRAASVTVGPVIIVVPEGFAAAQTQKQTKMLVTAWTKSVHSGSLKTLLQITVIDFDSSARAPAAAQDQTRQAENYLRRFLGDIERRRTNYVSSPLAHIELAGSTAVRATWNGDVAGRPLVGVMYCVIVENRYAVIFHTQDLGSVPSSGMIEAMRAIEAATLAHKLE